MYEGEIVREALIPEGLMGIKIDRVILNYLDFEELKNIPDHQLRPWVLRLAGRFGLNQPPKENPRRNCMKTLHITDINGAKENISDIKVFGDGDLFQLLIKASSEKEGWMKSTKAMETPHGCVVQVTTQQQNPDGSYSLAEALTYVPGVRVSDEHPDGGRALITPDWATARKEGRVK